MPKKRRLNKQSKSPPNPVFPIVEIKFMNLIKTLREQIIPSKFGDTLQHFIFQDKMTLSEAGYKYRHMIRNILLDNYESIGQEISNPIHKKQYDLMGGKLIADACAKYCYQINRFLCDLQIKMEKKTEPAEFTVRYTNSPKPEEVITVFEVEIIPQAAEFTVHHSNCPQPKEVFTVFEVEIIPQPGEFIVRYTNSPQLREVITVFEVEIIPQPKELTVHHSNSPTLTKFKVFTNPVPIHSIPYRWCEKIPLWEINSIFTKSDYRIGKIWQPNKTNYQVSNIWLHSKADYRISVQY